MAGLALHRRGVKAEIRLDVLVAECHLWLQEMLDESVKFADDNIRG